MEKSNKIPLKDKILKINPKRWWGDDFDVRFYLLSKISTLKDKTILDIGGGIGILSSNLDKSNICINLDISFNDLNQSKIIFGELFHIINGSMNEIPLQNNSVDCVICANLLEVAKMIDIENNDVNRNNSVQKYPTIIKVLDEIYRVLKPEGKLLITTPNNEYYKTSKLTYDELKNHLSLKFNNYSLFFYNTFPRLKSQNRKLNMANIIPKILSKFKSRDKIIDSLIHSDQGNQKYSVSFFVEARK